MTNDEDNAQSETKTLCSEEKPGAESQSLTGKFVKLTSSAEPLATVQAWPVPHIMVTYEGSSTAWGRDALRRAGGLVSKYSHIKYKYWPHQFIHVQSSRDAFCKGNCWSLARDGPNWKKFVKKNANKLRMSARFRTTNGTGLDEGFVPLQTVGWAELLQNVVEIRLTLTAPLETGKKSLFR